MFLMKWWDVGREYTLTKDWGNLHHSWPTWELTMSNLTEMEPTTAIDAQQLTELDRENFAVLSAAILEMRCQAVEVCQTLEDANQRLAKIYKIADRMHNVPNNMTRGQPCSAKNLYFGRSFSYDGLELCQADGKPWPVLSQRIDVETPIEAFQVSDIAKNFNNTIHLKQEQGT